MHSPIEVRGYRQPSSGLRLPGRWLGGTRGEGLGNREGPFTVLFRDGGTSVSVCTCPQLPQDVLGSGPRQWNVDCSARVCHRWVPVDVRCPCGLHRSGRTSPTNFRSTFLHPTPRSNSHSRWTRFVLSMSINTSTTTRLKLSSRIDCILITFYLIFHLTPSYLYH